MDGQFVETLVVVVSMVAGTEVDQSERSSGRSVHPATRQAHGTVACLMDSVVEPFE